MAKITLTQTGAEVQADLDKIEATPTITSIGSGLSLSSGVLSASGGSSSQGYNLTYCNETVSCEVYFLVSNNGQLTLQSYTEDTTVTISNVIAIINKTYEGQTLTGSSGSFLELPSCTPYSLGNSGSYQSYNSGNRDKTICILLSDVVFHDSD